MPSEKRNKKRNFFGAWRKCHGDPAKILERIGATMDDYNEWMKDPAFVERFEEAACNEELVPEDAESWLLLAKEIPIFKWYDPIYGFAKRAAALPEKERAVWLKKIGEPLRKKIESKVKQCLSGRFKPGFHSERDKQIAELICDQSLTDRERARKAGMTVGAFKTLKSAWMKNIAKLISYDKAPLPRWKRHKK